MDTILIAVIVLGVIGFTLSLVLYGVSRKFFVKEDPRIAQVADALPGANCGGCGYPGCSGLAAACVKAADEGSLEGLLCPVGGQDTMTQIAAVLGMESCAMSAKRVAVVCCEGSCAQRPDKRIYEGAQSCRTAHMAGMGATDCAYGCLGCGDCASHCQFGGVTMNPETGLPEFTEQICTACGSCVKACPRGLISLVPVDSRGHAVVVKCKNKDKGVTARNVCEVSCIGCKLCEKACESDAVRVEENVAVIDGNKCTQCHKCIEKCPRGCIVSVDMLQRAKSCKCGN